MKKTLSLMLSLLMVISIFVSVPVTASAASTSDLTFKLNKDGKSYSVSGCNSTASGSLAIPAKYKGKPVSAIGEGSFYYCTELKSVKIPDSVKSIGRVAFNSCESLKTVEIGNSVTTISYGAFEFCTSLPEVTIPSSVKSIEDNVFAYCSSLKEINVSAKNTEYSSSKGILFDEGKTSLIKYPQGKTSASYNVPGSVKTIEGEAFNNCDNLTSVEIPYGVKKIGYGAFSESEKLKSISIPNSVTSIEEGAFRSCTSLEKAKISNNVTSIERSTFANCSKLKSITIPTNVKIIDTYAFGGCESLKTVTMNYGVNSIGYGAFEDCKNLKSVKIPASVKEIVDNAFGYYFDYESYQYVKIKNFKIYGKKGSAAQKYAKENGFTFEAVTAPGKTKVKTIANTSTGVKLTWNKISKADYYEIFRKVKGGSYKSIGTTTSTSYIDKTAKSGTTYYYVVKCVNSAGKSNASNTLSIKFLATPTIKSISTAKAGVTIKWSKVAGASGYQVYRQTGNGSYAKIATIKNVATVAYLDKSAVKGKTYTYRVRAYMGNTTGTFSNTKKITDKY